MLFVSIPVLSIAIAVIILLSAYVKFEFSFDRHISTSDRVVRLYNQIESGDGVENLPISLRKAYVDINGKVPEVEAIAQIFRGWGINIKHNDYVFTDFESYYVDHEFFQVFGFDLIYGDKETALIAANGVVLTRSTALSIFGKLDIVGENLIVDDENYIVEGVIEDFPKTGHFSADILLNLKDFGEMMYLGGLEFFTYYLVKSPGQIESAKEKIAELNNSFMAPWSEGSDIKAESRFEMLNDIHLFSKVDFDLKPKGSIKTIIIISLIVAFIFIMAVINFVNLYVQHIERRNKEQAIRKCVGANISNLIHINLLEILVILTIAFVLALVLVLISQSKFAELIYSNIELPDMFNFSGILLLVAIFLILFISSTVYPLQRIIKLNATNKLVEFTRETKRKSQLSLMAVVVQFFSTVVLVFCLIIISHQMRYLKKIPLGVNTENTVGIYGYNFKQMPDDQILCEEIEALPFVDIASTSEHFMGGGCSGQRIKVDGQREMSINQYRVHKDYLDIFDIPIVVGRDFNSGSGDKTAIIMNQAAVKKLGLSEPLGTKVEFMDTTMEIIGVVGDFISSDKPGLEVQPIVLTNYSKYSSVINMKFNTEPTAELMTQVEDVIQKYQTDFKMSTVYFDKIYGSKLAQEDREFTLASYGAFLAILLSCIILIAISLMNILKRRKEIGIRKVLGSSVNQILIALLKKTFIALGISMIIAFVLSYYIMSQWLQNYAYHIDINIFHFLISGLLCLAIALSAMIFQSLHAARSNPVKSLRYE